MLVNPIYGASGSSPTPPVAAPRISIGGSFGDPLGGTTGSITVTTTGHVGETALFIVMHRADITVDSTWEFVDKRTTVYDDTYEQHISIYKKTIETSAETYTITSTAARMYCTMYYSDKDIDVAYQQIAKMEKQNINGSDCAVLQVEPTDEILVVFNTPYTNAYSGMSVRIENGTIIPQYYTAPGSGDLTAARMVSFFTAQKTKIVYYPWDDQQFTTADVFIYKIPSGPVPESSGYVEGAVAIHENKSWETADLYQYISGTLGLPSIDTSTGFTVEARVAPTQPTQNYPSFFSLEGSGKRVLLGLSTSASEKDESSDFGIDVWGWVSGTEIIFKPANINYGDWHTFTFTADANAVKLYIDGQLFETQTAVTGTLTPTSISQMYYPYMTRYTKGKWGCTRWYNRVLTADEIAANYAIDAERYDET